MRKIIIAIFAMLFCHVAMAGENLCLHEDSKMMTQVLDADKAYLHAQLEKVGVPASKAQISVDVHETKKHSYVTRFSSNPSGLHVSIVDCQGNVVAKSSSTGKQLFAYDVYYSAVFTDGAGNLATQIRHAKPSTEVIKTFDFQTNEHNVRLLVHPNDYVTYQSWNKPKAIGEGQPDLQIQNGSESTGLMEKDCAKEVWSFFSGDKTVLVDLCDKSDEHPNAIGKLSIFEKSKIQDTYWLYQKN